MFWIFFIQRNSFPLVFYLSFWLFLCYPRRAEVRWRNNQIFCLIDGFPISLYAMGLRRARSLLRDFVSYAKSQPKFKQMIISNKLNCFKQAELKEIPWVTLLKTSSPLDNIHVLTRQNWQNVDQGNWKTIKKFYYKVRYEIFLRKCDSLRQLDSPLHLQSAMDCLTDSKLRQLFFLFYNYKVRQGYYIATRITKRDDYTACNSTRVPPPSLPSLEFKGIPRLHAKTEELLIQVSMRIYSLNYLSELHNYSLVLQPQPTSKDKKGRSPMNALNLISIMKSMLL